MSCLEGCAGVTGLSANGVCCIEFQELLNASLSTLLVNPASSDVASSWSTADCPQQCQDLCSFSVSGISTHSTHSMVVRSTVMERVNGGMAAWANSAAPAAGVAGLTSIIGLLLPSAISAQPADDGACALRRSVCCLEIFALSQRRRSMHAVRATRSSRSLRCHRAQRTQQRLPSLLQAHDAHSATVNTQQ